MCYDGSVDKCQESDFKETVSCNLKHCPKTLGDWNDVGPCIADGDDPMCGPGKQNQTRICTHGTVLNCTDADRNQIVPCSLPDCPKTLGQWNKSAPCKSDADNRNCGPGIQEQTRNCTDGTTDICTNADRKQEVRCQLTPCPKLLGNWTSDGICESSGNHKICGKGLRKEKRTCTDGTSDVCTATDTEKYVECNLPACFKEMGSWTNMTGCVGVGLRSECGPAVQKQSRICMDGAIANCTSADRERDVPCSLPDCIKLYGTWINEGQCTTLDAKKCGPGHQLQTRTCSDGTHTKCTTNDTTRVQPCSLPHCPKILGDWSDVGYCIPSGTDKNCGPGNQIQARSCENGTIDTCTKQDQNRSISCNLPDCPKKLSEWVTAGCIGTNPNSTCDATGLGHRVQKRNCTDGTKEKCHLSDMERNLWSVTCELPKCPSKIPDINE